MRTRGWLLAILIAQACGLDHDHAPDATVTEADASVDDAIVLPDAAGCVPLASDVLASWALGAYVDVQDPSAVAETYGQLFTGAREWDLFVPISVTAIDATHLELDAIVASEYTLCSSEAGYAYDCSTYPTGARARYAIRLDPALPTATLVRAEVIPRSTARDAFLAIAGSLARYPSCDVLPGWDVWTVPADTTNGPSGDYAYTYGPPGFGAVVLVERATARAWRLTLPTLPGACADAWAGAETGPDCAPAMGFPRDPSSTEPHTLTFAAAPIGRPRAPWTSSCALQRMCVGACDGCVDRRIYTGPPCPPDLAWTRTVCAARTLDEIPTTGMSDICATAACSSYGDAGL